MIFKKDFRKLLYFATLAFSLSIQSATDKPYNVLFIIADDLNDYVNGLGGHPQSKTPNLDKFAKTGAQHNQNKVQYVRWINSQNINR